MQIHLTDTSTANTPCPSRHPSTLPIHSYTLHQVHLHFESTQLHDPLSCINLTHSLRTVDYCHNAGIFVLRSRSVGADMSLFLIYLWQCQSASCRCHQRTAFRGVLRRSSTFQVADLSDSFSAIEAVLSSGALSANPVVAPVSQ